MSHCIKTLYALVRYHICYMLLNVFSSLFFFQLDPQTVQSKNWHMDVIEMNGVRHSVSLLGIVAHVHKSVFTVCSNYSDRS